MNAITKNVRSGTDPGHPHDGVIPVHSDPAESSAGDTEGASAPETILTVLLKLQYKYSAFGKSETGHGYKYVSLSRMLEQMRDDLQNAQVLVLHSSAINENIFTLTTKLLHVQSGTEISTQYVTPFAEQKVNSNAQVTGGYETYGRRYNLFKLLNCATEDNDAADVFRISIDRLDKAESLDELKEIMHDSQIKSMKVTFPKVWEQLAAHCAERKEQIETAETEEEGGDDADSDS